jgi:hypothetical protein
MLQPTTMLSPGDFTKAYPCVLKALGVLIVLLALQRHLALGVPELAQHQVVLPLLAGLVIPRHVFDWRLLLRLPRQRALGCLGGIEIKCNPAWLVFSGRDPRGLDVKGPTSYALISSAQGRPMVIIPLAGGASLGIASLSRVVCNKASCNN